MRTLLERFVLGHALNLDRDLKELGTRDVDQSMKGFWEFRSQGPIHETRLFGFFARPGAFVGLRFGSRAGMEDADFEAEKRACDSLWENLVGDKMPICTPCRFGFGQTYRPIRTEKMMNEAQFSLPFASWPSLTADEHDDAFFRGKDLAWSCLAGLYDDRAAEDDTLSYQALGDRIGRSRAQVQRWIDSPHNMTLRSLSLLAEGLDADLKIDLTRRVYGMLANTCHPAEAAKLNIPLQAFKEKLRNAALLNNVDFINSKNAEVLNSSEIKWSFAESGAHAGGDDSLFDYELNFAAHTMAEDCT